MSNYHPQNLLKMTTYIHHFLSYVEHVLHPAAGKSLLEKKRKTTGKTGIPPSATPDSLDLRSMLKKQDHFRRNPAP